MNYNIEISNIKVVVERPFNLRGKPAASFQADNLKVSADLDQLVDGFKDLLKKIMPEFTEPSFEDEQRVAKETLDRMVRNDHS